MNYEDFLKLDSTQRYAALKATIVEQKGVPEDHNDLKAALLMSIMSLCQHPETSTEAERQVTLFLLVKKFE